MLASLKSFNMLVMFLLELSVYAAASLWGFTASDKWPLKLLLGIGAPVALIAVWALFGSPKASYPVHGAGRVVLEVLWFGSGAAALAASGRTGWAVAFAGIFVVNAGLRLLWNQ
ncbi:YrdB family protein [Streptomyces sp. NBC_00094]|uniref:YrdB family protein n=1 Tax=Streptomyces sp. NBC_00094 TaxID=2903620 RepID=UPI0022521CBF|nr:YrdB family protein [Streptomyces sp. NBC_00094]MCX5390360.1 YrdB family protein [Streptomyces sp. NBC_00094]